MRSLFLLLPLLVACGHAAPPGAAPPHAPATAAPATAAPATAAPAPVAEAPRPGSTEAEKAARAFFEEEAMRKQLEEAPKAKAPPPPPPPTRSEARGKLKTKPAKGSMTVTVDSRTPAPAVGDKAELLRRVDPSLPLIGGSWLVIADTEVTGVAGSTVTLRIVAEKAQMKINGRKLDHFTPGVPIRLGWTASTD